jgi:hypothetical protein
MSKKQFKGFSEEAKRKFLFPPKKKLKKWCKRANNGDAQAMMNLNNYMNLICENAAQKEGSTMISEKDYVPMECCLCGAHMPSIHNTHNPYPLAPNTTAKMALEQNLPHRCCSECVSTKVISARMSIAFDQSSKDDFYNNLFKDEGSK